MENEKDVKELIVKVIPAKVANAFVRKNHYSGSVVGNSKLHFGVFYHGVLHGAMQFGSPMDKKKVLGLVDVGGGTVNENWHKMLELNRMAFDNDLPKNSESRSLSVAFRLLKKNAPHVKWILSFSDGTQAGDGTIYRATGFNLTQIKPNNSIWLLPDGQKIVAIVWTNIRNRARRAEICKQYSIKNDGSSSMRPLHDIGAKPLEGFQLRYIKILDPKCKLACENLPYATIDKVGAGMYLGKKRNQTSERREHENNAASFHEAESGAIPTPTHQTKQEATK